MREALLQVMHQCNFACSHCSQDAPLLRSPANIPSAAALVSAVKRLRNLGHRRIRFTGGEPFLHPALEEVVAAAVREGLQVSFVSNGSHFDVSRRHWLRSLGPFEFWLSFYGYPKQVHDAVCGREGACERAFNAATLLIGDGHSVNCYYALTYPALGGCRAFIERAATTGILAVKIIQLFNQGRARAEYLRMSATDATLETLLSQLRVISRPRVLVSVKSGQRALFERNGFTVPDDTACHAGLDGPWTVDAKEFIYPCCLFMNLGIMRSAHLRDPDLEQTATKLGHRHFVVTVSKAYLSDDHQRIARCPAIAEPPTHSESAFICPLTYAEPI